MRITHDKNGDPFGYCEATCSQQMRIGGDKSRVARFVARHPWAGKTPVTDTEPKPAAKAAPEPVPTPEPEPKPAPKRAPGLADVLAGWGLNT